MRTTPIALVLAGLTAPLLGTGFAHAQAPADDVRAGAQAVSVRVVPYVGVPGFSGALGITTAQVDSGTAAASAGVADLGLLGTIINANAPGEAGEPPRFQLPEPISAESGKTETAQRYPLHPPGAPDPGGASVGSGAHETVSATEDPLAASGVVTGPELHLPGVLRMTGGLSRSLTDTSRALGEVTLGQLVLGEGAVVLAGLRWSASKAPGKDAEQSFTLGSMTVSGQAMPVGSSEEIADAFAAANQALEPTGLSIGVPAVVGTASEGAVAPLVLQFRSPSSLVEPGAQVSEVTKPALLGLSKTVLDAYPDAAAAQIVVNALVGASSGRSGGRLEFGGVSARADLLPPIDQGPSTPAVVPPTTPVVPEIPPGAPPIPVGDDTAPIPAASYGLTGPDLTPNETTPGAINLHGTASAAQPATSSDSLGGRGHAAIALGVGLLLLLLLALADRLRAA